MGLGGASIWQIAIIIAIVLLLFGTKKLSSVGSDIGHGLKNFRKAIKEDDK